MIVPLADEVGRCIFFTGDYDKKLTWLCKKILRSGNTTLDIGANLGLVSMTMAKCVGPTGIVHAFEPNPVLQSLIRRSLAKNSISNVITHESALGAKPGELDLHVPQGNAGQGSFVYHSETPDSQHHRCKIERLSDVAEQHGLSSIAMIKIDVEGFENDVLLGASRILRDIRPVIIIETNEQNQPPFRERAAIMTLRNASYHFLAIPKAMLFLKIDPSDVYAIDDPGHDVIAVPEEKFSGVVDTLT